MAIEPIKMIGAILWPVAIFASVGTIYLIITKPSSHVPLKSENHVPTSQSAQISTFKNAEKDVPQNSTSEAKQKKSGKDKISVDDVSKDEFGDSCKKITSISDHATLLAAVANTPFRTVYEGNGVSISRVYFVDVEPRRKGSKPYGCFMDLETRGILDGTMRWLKMTCSVDEITVLTDGSLRATKCYDPF